MRTLPFRTIGLGIVSLGLLAIVTACSQGTYPIDWAPEMHYQPSYKAQEPDRLSTPKDSIAFVSHGGEDSVFAVTDNTYFTLRATKTGAELFAINCAMCHGKSGRGDGMVLETLIGKYGYLPAMTPDLTDKAVQDLPDSALMGLISGGVVIMPSFAKLLSEEELQLVVEYIKELG